MSVVPPVDYFMRPTDYKGTMGIPPPASRWPLPQYFTNLPQDEVVKSQAASPLGLSMLKEIFPSQPTMANYAPVDYPTQGWPAYGGSGGVWGNVTGASSIAAGHPTAFYNMEQPKKGENAPLPQRGITEAIMPMNPSAQWWQRAQALNILPLLRGYVEGILNIPWSEFQNTVQTSWATTPAVRQPSLRAAPRQR